MTTERQPIATESDCETRQLVIIGSGVAGYTAGIYTGRARLNPLLIAGNMYGGQLMQTTEIENYPGFVQGISGTMLMRVLHEQAERFGTEIERADVISVDTYQYPYTIVLNTGYTLKAKSIIITTGARALWLDAKGEEELKGKGLSTCATCDGPFYKDREVVVIGGGDSAMEEAIFLTRFASKVTVINRSEKYRASKIMLDRARGNSKIEWKSGYTVEEWISKKDINGFDELVMVVLRKVDDNTLEEVVCTGGFIAIGHSPTTEFLKGSGVEIDDGGYICLKENTMTSVQGVFAAGDVTDHRYKQAITAAGQGCQAAMDCMRWLEEYEYHIN
jgi:thioredoxin reductase (NADPH)